MLVYVSYNKYDIFQIFHNSLFFFKSLWSCDFLSKYLFPEKSSKILKNSLKFPKILKKIRFFDSFGPFWRIIADNW